MWKPKRLAAALVSLLLLGAPAPAALAQSAGDEQYQDPLPQAPPGDGGGGGAAGGDGPPIPPQGPDSTGAPPSDSGPDATTGAPGATTAAGELPRTGAEPVLMAAFGFALLLTGAGLRLAAPRR